MSEKIPDETKILVQAHTCTCIHTEEKNSIKENNKRKLFYNTGVRNGFLYMI